MYQMPSLIAHEFTARHPVLSAAFILSPTAATNVSMNSWEAEGQAMFARNAVGDTVLGYASGNDDGRTVAHTGQGDRSYGQGFDLLTSYFGFAYTSLGKNGYPQEQCVVVSEASCRHATAVHSTARRIQFEKYITDRYAAAYPGGEKGFHHDIIDRNPGLAGATNWATTVGFASTACSPEWGAMSCASDNRVSADLHPICNSQAGTSPISSVRVGTTTALHIRPSINRTGRISPSRRASATAAPSIPSCRLAARTDRLP